MLRKMKKYVKAVICIVLMLSLVIPMYAANSASDPSAFITKEEFDKALADFNQRLVTFEAGINSKIDSQVTSYLDRNGIWSYVEQEFITDSDKGGGSLCLFDFGTINSNTSSGTLGSSEINNIGFFGYWNRNMTKYWRCIPSQMYLYASKKIVNNCTKGGLCIAQLEFGLNVDVTTNMGLTNAGLWIGASDTHEKWFQAWQFLTQQDIPNTNWGNANKELVFNESDGILSALPDDIFGQQMLISATFQASNSDDKVKYFTCPCGYYSYVGFVEKGKPLFFGVAAIGANDTHWRIKGVDKCHVSNWYLLNANIKIY